MLWYILKYYTRTLSDHITVAFERQHKYVKRCYSDDFNVEYFDKKQENL